MILSDARSLPHGLAHLPEKLGRKLAVKGNIVLHTRAAVAKRRSSAGSLPPRARMLSNVLVSHSTCRRKRRCQGGRRSRGSNRRSFARRSGSHLRSGKDRQSIRADARASESGCPPRQHAGKSIELVGQALAEAIHRPLPGASACALRRSPA
jgi:hypothetical protein